MGGLPVLPRQPEGSVRRAVGPHARLPPLVQRGPRHRDVRVRGGPMRLPTGGRIDRATTLRFTLDGVEHTGFAGDTLASAMLANGLLTVGPSQYRRRPRGIVTAGLDEPNALVQVDGEPSLTATTVELVDGLSASLLSGVGRLAPLDDVVHDKKYVHTDVLVVGGGPAGLAAALAASAGGARVLLVDDGPTPGGSLLSDPTPLAWF